MFATIFGLIIDELYEPAFLSFCKYWPDDDLFRPKLIANIWNNKIKIYLYQTEYIFYFILILKSDGFFSILFTGLRV